jgi:hypothetical protein
MFTEHRDNAETQQKALQTIGNGFTKVLTDQRDSFSSLVTKSDTAFKETTRRASAQFNAAMKKAQQNLDHMTGGNSFPNIEMVPVPIGGSINTFRLVLTISGKNPIFDVNISIRQLPLPQTESASAFLTTGTLPGVSLLFSGASISPGAALPLQGSITPSLEKTSDYQIITIARNGTFTEELHIRRQGEVHPNDHGIVLPWEQSYDIKRGQKRMSRVPWHATLCAGCAAQPLK